jgi:hypothetical protein
MKANRKDIEFYREMLMREHDEKILFQQKASALEEQLSRLEESHRAETASMLNAIETLRLTVEELTRTNQSQTQQIANLLASDKLGRGKRFAPTTEQRNLLNNRNVDKRAEEKNDFDGTNPPSAGASSSGETQEATSEKPKEVTKKKKSAGRKPSLDNYDCDCVVRHKLGEYFEVPEGATLKKREGKIELHEYISYEYVPGKIIKHVWETASYETSDGESCNTLPAEQRNNPVKGCPFTAEMLAFILVEKYAYHSSKNQIKRKLREMGARFSKSTFVRYYGIVIEALREMMEGIFKKTTVDCNYLMIDETCELVGVKNEETGKPEYKKRYLWAFHNKMQGLVSYLYEKGSRAREVMIGMLKGFKGTILTDGYNAYHIFDKDDGYPDVMRCGCWAHARRCIVEAIGVAGEECYTLLDHIHDLFRFETIYKGMDDNERLAKRQTISLPKLNLIFNTARMFAKDQVLMGKNLMKRAINYLLNQETSLRNFLKDGRADLSNNLCEQRMKPIKLDMKTCQNIGSETAAQNAAFMHSLVESCRLNNLNPYEYLKSLFKNIGRNLDDTAKRMLLPDKWAPKC